MTLQDIDTRIKNLELDLQNVLATYHRFQGLIEEAKYWKQQLVNEQHVNTCANPPQDQPNGN